MNVTLNDPVLIVDDVRNIFVERDGNKMTIQYGDLQIDDLFYMEDSNGRPRRYRVVDISGTASGNCEITTEMVTFSMRQLYGTTI